MLSKYLSIDKNVTTMAMQCHPKNYLENDDWRTHEYKVVFYQTSFKLSFFWTIKNWLLDKGLFLPCVGLLQIQYNMLVSLFINPCKEFKEKYFNTPRPL